MLHIGPFIMNSVYLVCTVSVILLYFKVNVILHKHICIFQKSVIAIEMRE